MSWKTKILSFVIFVIVVIVGMFAFYPRGASLIMSYKKECRVTRAEPFLKGLTIAGTVQMNKISIACEDGFICRAEDTGFSAVKPGDVIEFRGYPEFSTIEEWGKCEHAQLIRIISQ